MYRKLLIFLVAAVLVISLCYAQGIRYRIVREYVTLSVEPDAVCTLTYNLTVRVEEGVIPNYVAIGMPNPDFTVIEVLEVETGEELSHEEVKEPDNCRVVMHISSPIGPGEERTFYLVAEVRNLVFKDKENPGNAGLQFTPSWYDAPIDDLRVTIILPPGVGRDEFRNVPDYDNLLTVDGRVALYWERHGLAPGEKFTVGVSFPEEYLTVSVPEAPSELTFTWEDIFAIVLVIIFFGAIIVSIIIGVMELTHAMKKETYESPFLMIEALGPRKGLYAPEAAWLIESGKRKPDYTRILTMILYSLVRKGAVEIVSTSPLRLKVLGEVEGLRYYERAFLKCIEEDGALKEKCLVKVIDVLDKGVAEKIRGYNRRETVEYYRKIVERAWREVEEAETPEVRLRKAEENTEWLMLDPAFPDRIVVILNHPDPYTPPPTDPWVKALPPSERKPSLSIVEFADKTAKTFETITHNIVTDIERFADTVARTIEGRTAAQGRSRPIYSVSCACVSCACVCACVSCACACASGGVG